MDQGHRKRYRAVRAIARRMSKGHGKKVVSVAAAMAFAATIMMESHAVPKRSNKANFDTDNTMIDDRGTACNSDNPFDPGTQDHKEV
jgi:hypothetical protein